MSRYVFILIATLTAGAGTCFAQTASKNLDLSGPLLQSPSFSEPAKGKTAPQKSRKSTRQSQSSPSAPVVDPYEKARKAQDAYFKQQADKSAKAAKDNDPGRWGSNGNSIFGNGGAPTGPSTWTNPR